MAKHEENPYAPPKSDMLGLERHLEQSDVAWCDKSKLVVRKGADLSDRCLKCNEPADGRNFTRTLSWLPSIWIVAFLISPLLYVLIYLLLRSKGKVTVGLCPLHRGKRARAIALGWLTALAGIGTFFLAGAIPDQVGGFTIDRGSRGIAVLVGAVLLLAGLISGALGARVLVPSKIDKHFIWLTKVSPELLAGLRDWNV
jgi:hypothetical protein